MDFTLKKDERLCSQKTIGELFASGESFLVFPFKVVFMKNELPQAFPAQTAFAVSKRTFKRAVKRNILKRRMREAFRLNKNPFYDQLASKNLHISIIFIFIGKDILEYNILEKAMISAFKKTLAKL